MAVDMLPGFETVFENLQKNTGSLSIGSMKKIRRNLLTNRKKVAKIQKRIVHTLSVSETFWCIEKRY
jgi:hypothetical protein